MPHLWIASEMNARRPCRIIIIRRCELLGDERPGRYGPMETACLARIVTANLKMAAAYALIHVLHQAQDGDIIISDGLSKPRELGARIRRLLLTKKVTFYSPGANPEDWNLREEGFEIARHAFEQNYGAALPYFEPPLVPNADEEDFRRIPIPSVPAPSTIGREGIVHLPHPGKLPDTYLASDISLGDGRRAAYAVCRVKEDGAVECISDGVFDVSRQGKTTEAETYALLIACRLAGPGEGIVCDILFEEMWQSFRKTETKVHREIVALVEAKQLSLFTDADESLRGLHNRCHTRCRQVLRDHFRTQVEEAAKNGPVNV